MISGSTYPDEKLHRIDTKVILISLRITTLDRDRIPNSKNVVIMTDIKSQLDNSLHERKLPDHVGTRILATVTVTMVVLLATMEVKARQDNYRISYYPPTEELWVSQWIELDSLPDIQLIVIGASRMQFGIIVPEWNKLTGIKPQMLAWPGSPPGPVLSKLAQRKSFKGTVLCGIAPPFSFAPDTMPVTQRIQRNFSIINASRISLSFHLSMAARDFLIPTFKFLNSFAYSPVLLSYTYFPIPNRDRLLIPDIFPFGGSLDRELQFRFRPNAESVLHFDILDKITEAGLRKLHHYGPADMDPVVAQFKKDVKTIESRGGQVIFLRPPSDGTFRQFERDYYPRKRFFDRVVQETSCLGIHFEDYPELRDFICVEESHLSVKDGLEFTRRIVAILRRENAIDQ